jgi:hypothetical protein
LPRIDRTLSIALVGGEAADAGADCAGGGGGDGGGGEGGGEDAAGAGAEGAEDGAACEGCGVFGLPLILFITLSMAFGWGVGLPDPFGGGE